MSVFLGNPQVLPTRGVPTQGPLTDRFGRTATDLRISITDKCNLRCTYCMPAEGMQWLPRESLLTVEEIVRLARIAVTEFAVREIRLTGGEPLIRPDLEQLVQALNTALPGVPVSMTSNGIGLAARAQGLADAGMTRINISLDTLCAETYERLARRGRLTEALDGVAAARRAGMSPVKINAVLMRGVNEHEAPELLHWALENACDLRFIEQMPLDADHGWTRENMVSAAQIRESLSRDFDLTPDTAPRAGAPAEKYLVRRRAEDRVVGTVGIIASVTEPFCEDCTRTRITAEGHVRSCLFSQMPLDADHGWTRENMVSAAQIRESLSRDFDLTPDTAPRAGAPAEKYLVRRRAEDRVVGTVGIIASVTEPFCEDCTRTRITAEGHVRSCLFSHHETDLMHLLRSGATDAQVTQRWREAMWVKPRAHGMEHTGLDSGDYIQPDRSMSAIGG